MSNAELFNETPEERAARIDAAIATAQAALAGVNPEIVWSNELIKERRAEALRDLLDETSA
ncbi:MAG: hypothetical protein ACOYN3_08620 [Acidimicrobiia bacterium]